jgi:hypothetical protein
MLKLDEISVPSPTDERYPVVWPRARHRKTFPRIPGSHRLLHRIRKIEDYGTLQIDLQLHEITTELVECGLRGHNQHQHCLSHKNEKFTARTNIAQRIHVTPIIRNEAAWPRMKSVCQNRPHGLIYMRASRRGRIFALSTKPYQRWLSNLGSASGWDSPLASSKRS